MKRLLFVAAACVACGGAADSEPTELVVERLGLPAGLTLPVEVAAGVETASCETAACELGFVLPVAPVVVEAQDPLGNEFHLPITDISAGTHRVEAPLAPDAGVFLPYVLEYTVR